MSATPAYPADALDAIRSGYSFEEPALDVGVALAPAADASDAAAASPTTPDPTAPIRLPLGMMNRHGLIAGATGTGKTVTLQVLAEQLSRAGVPVFASDIKGDLSGLSAAGQHNPKLAERTQAIGQDWSGRGCPVEFASLGGIGTGVPLRATVTDFGPLLLSKVLELNDTQESVLSLIFHFADQAGLALLDLSDLRAVLNHLDSPEGKEDFRSLGGASAATLGVILRQVAQLEAAGGEDFFGEPAFDTADLLRTTDDGQGVITLLGLCQLQDRPALFSTFLMWLLADLFQDLPEVGDPDKPSLVFFFDEAHLLFADASKAFLDSVTRTVRLIRSKGVGVFFVTQTPKDVPEDVLAQLGSRVQHQLRAHTPNDQKALRATVQTFPTSAYDLEKVLTTLRTGEAVVTVMDPDGAPTPVAATRMRAPESQIGPVPAADLEAAVAASPLTPKYGERIDRESAREILTARMEAGSEAAEADAGSQQESATQPADDTAAEAPGRIPAPSPQGGGRGSGGGAGRGSGSSRGSARQEKSAFDKVVSSPAFKQFTRTAAREIARGLFGTGRRRR
ncbi:helicase HerA-like domain-containing protein [Brevibacterium senegalense]|uniref:helicase HerA-like domain-containing protein n=1 Tax=Brevibacterium senegalense TaxID=1033736 RepID=UPI0002E4703A|nr:helicase HerA-like domain-containing protein [Brevibacterium senegalense]